MSKTLEGCVCLVTGASRGLGRGIAIGLGECGATVYITGRTLKAKNGSGEVLGSLEDTAAEIASRGGVAIPVAVDHADDSQVTNLFQRIRREQKGRLDLLVNNAFSAVDYIIAKVKGDKSFWELLPDQTPGSEWDCVNKVGLRNHYICSVLATRMMLEYRNEFDPESQSDESSRPGLIVNISSPGSIHRLFNAAYGIGKSATDRMTVELAGDLKSKQRGVSVISVWPGIVKTEKVLGSGSSSYDLEAIGESSELTGRVIAAIMQESRDKLMSRSGRTFLVADTAYEKGIRDDNGRYALSIRSYKFMLNISGWKTLSSYVPSFFTIPYFMLPNAFPKY